MRGVDMEPDTENADAEDDTEDSDVEIDNDDVAEDAIFERDDNADLYDGLASASDGKKTNTIFSVQSAVVGCISVGILLSILGLGLIIHRLKKKDEGSYRIVASPSSKQALLSNEEAYA
jgi:hypothetical protein